jgi:hypothetical protein
MERFTLSMIAVMLTLIMFVSPAAANPVSPTITKIFIEHDGHPIDSTVNFSVNCFGSPRPQFMVHKNNGLASSRKEGLVYSYSVNCSSNGCPSYNTYDTWMFDITTCNLEGTYKEKPFQIENYSDPALSADCIWIVEPDSMNEESYLGITADAMKPCYTLKNKAWDECDLLLKPKWTKENATKYSRCIDNATNGLDACFISQSHKINLNKTDVQNSPWSWTGYYCEIRFSIPSDNITSAEVIPARTVVSYSVPDSPIASIYCSIVQFLGGRCE